jgi:hypothetical protein
MYKMQQMSLTSAFDYQSAHLKYTPFEYIPSQRELYVYDMRIVFHYKDEVIPFHEHLHNRSRRFSLAGVYPIDDEIEEKNASMLGFNYAFKSYPGTRKLLLDEYEIPPSMVE